MNNKQKRQVASALRSRKGQITIHSVCDAFRELRLEVPSRQMVSQWAKREKLSTNPEGLRGTPSKWHQHPNWPAHVAGRDHVMNYLNGHRDKLAA